jgi:hypothetical protein
MWQKERLLNIGINHLPKDCDYVAWIDCDVIFGQPGWVSDAVHELDRAGVCHLYRSVYHLARDAASISREASTVRHDSLGYAMALGLEGSIGSVTEGIPAVFKRGHALCARRELIAKHEVYDRNILGGGDRLLAHAVTGQAEELISQDRMTPAHADDYRRWTAQFCRDVKAIGYIEGDIFHLWHGDLERRLYRERLRILSSCEYDPAADIALDAERCWRWKSPKPEMHRRIREYFEQRDEDGEESSRLLSCRV